jgi:hypothetical protein
VRRQWLDRLFEAIQKDDPPYIESLGDHWGDLCTTLDPASAWADQLLHTLRNVLRKRQSGTYAFFSGTTLCYSALFKANRHDQILELLAMDTRPIWPYRVWGGQSTGNQRADRRSHHLPARARRQQHQQNHHRPLRRRRTAQGRSPH